MGCEVNKCKLLVGPPEVGKSSLMLQDMHADLAAGHWVFAHDPSGDFESACVAYDNTEAWLAAMREATPEKPMPRGAAFRCDPDELAGLLVRIGESYRRNRNGYHRNVTFPMDLYLDEASLLEDAGSSFVKGNFKRILANRRHYGLGLEVNMQYAGQLMKAFILTATEVALFVQAREEERRAAEKALALPTGTLERLGNLPAHRYLCWSKKQRGLL